MSEPANIQTAARVVHYVDLGKERARLEAKLPQADRVAACGERGPLFSLPLAEPAARCPACAEIAGHDPRSPVPDGMAMFFLPGTIQGVSEDEHAAGADFGRKIKMESHVESRILLEKDGTRISLDNSGPSAIAWLKMSFTPAGEIVDALPDGYDRDARITDFDVEIAAHVSLDAVHAARRNIAARSMSFFARLAALSREDDRLRELMDGYAIRIAHGDRVLFESRGPR